MKPPPPSRTQLLVFLVAVLAVPTIIAALVLAQASFAWWLGATTVGGLVGLGFTRFAVGPTHGADHEPQ